MNKFRLCLLGAILASPAPASAHIACDGTFQILPTGHVSTPFCQDEDLARTARAQGIAVTGASIRENPSLKAKLCATSSTLPACTSSNDD